MGWYMWIGRDIAGSAEIGRVPYRAGESMFLFVYTSLYMYISLSILSHIAQITAHHT